MTELYVNGYGEKVFGAAIPGGINIIFNNDGGSQTSDIEQIADGRWWYYQDSALKHMSAQITPATPATCTTDGNIKYYTMDEKTIDSEPKVVQSTVVEATGHQHVTNYPGVPADYNNTGTEEYWKCDDCQKLFSDAECQNEIDAPVVIPVLEGAVAQINGT